MIHCLRQTAFHGLVQKVIITKHGSPLKGYVAIVKDVHRGQDTLSSLRTFVQLLHLDPSAPFKTAIVNYDDIVEQK